MSGEGDLLLRPWAILVLRTIAGDSRAARLIVRKLPWLEELFDRNWYSSAYPDVRSSRYDPLVHYMAFGAAEGRNPHPLFDTAYYVRQHPEAGRNALLHYVREGAEKRFRTHPERGFCLFPRLRRPLRVLTLLVRYGADKYAGADERLEDLLRRTLPDAERRTVIIDNALEPGFERRLDAARVLIGGDNSSWEFSGWDRGIQFIGTEIGRFDFVHFATDAFEQFDAEFPAWVNVSMLEALRFGPAVAGHIDFYNEPASLFGQAMEYWIRSSFFFLRPSEVEALGSLVSVQDRSGLFTGDPSHPFREDSPVSSKLAGYLRDWLTGEGLGQGVQWHSRFELNADTLAHFEAKAVAILNELLLSRRLQSIGCWMADVTWVQGVLDGRVPGCLFEEHWRDQVRNRQLRL
jgi:hypothetical protein